MDKGWWWIDLDLEVNSREFGVGSLMAEVYGDEWSGMLLLVSLEHYHFCTVVFSCSDNKLCGMFKIPNVSICHSGLQKAKFMEVGEIDLNRSQAFGCGSH